MARAPAALLACALCALVLAAIASGQADSHRASHTHRRAARACHRHRRRCHAASRHRRGTPRSQSGAPATFAPVGTGADPASAAPTPAGANAPTATSPVAPTAPSVPAGSPPEEAAPARVQVIAKEYSFTLSRAEVPAGKVIVEFVDGGEDPHNLHLLQAAEGEEAGSFPTSAPGTHSDLSLELRAGSYTLFCSLPHHEEKGMKATLTVR